VICKKNTKQRKSKYELVKLDDRDLFNIKSGGTPRTSIKEYWDSKDIKWITIEDLPNRKNINVLNDSVRKISRLGYEKSSATLIQPKSVIISSRATIGAIAVNEVELSTNQGFKSIEIRQESKIHYKFLAYIMLNMQEELHSLAPKGATYQEFSKTKLENLYIPLPPLAVQQNIIERIEKIDDEIQSLETNFESYFKKLDINLFGENIRLEDICEYVQRGKSTKYGKSDILIIKSGQARGFYKIDLKEKFYAKETYKPDHRILEKGDVLINSTGVGTAGRVTVYNDDLGKSCVDSHITICRPLDDVALGEYIMIALNKVYGNKAIENMALGQSGQIEPNLDLIKKIKIPLPPLAEQKKIVITIVAEREKIELNKQKVKELEVEKQSIINEIWIE
jgi:type I restriction enzyme M protein